MTKIHPTAIVDSKAKIGPNVEIGPYSIIGPEVTVKEGLEKTIEWVKKEGVNIGIPFNERYEMEY